MFPFELLLLFLLLVAGFVSGRIMEQRHYKSIFQREDAFRHILLLRDKVPPPVYSNMQSQLVSGSVVISVDFFKTMIAALRGLVGGRIGVYESLVDRARREALLRMQQQANALGAQAILNVKLDTARIGINAAQATGGVEVFAYGTAVFPRR